MATDITDMLLKKSQVSVAKAQPVRQNQFVPEIPSSNVDVALPQEVLNALNTTQSVSKSVINSERRRIDATADAVKEANKEINAANLRIQEIDSSPLLQFQGMFDSDYSYHMQETRVKNAKTKLQQKNTELDIQRQREALDLKEANLPLDMYKFVTSLQASKANLSAVQANAIVQSNAARKQVRGLLQQEYTDEQLNTMQKTGEYDDVWTPQEVKSYQDAKQKFNLDIQSKELANASGRVDLVNKLEVQAISNLPIPWAKSLIASAEKSKSSLVQIPGTNTTVPLVKLQTALAEKQVAQQKAFTSTAETQLKLVKNDAEWTSMITDLGNVSAIFSGDGSNLSNMSNLNLLNITDEALVDFPFDSLHPELRGDFQTVLQTASILNEKSRPTLDVNGKEIAPAVGVTTQDVFTFKQTILDLNKKASKVKTDMIDTAPDKGSKAAMKEWFANGRMDTQDNSAAMLVSNSITLPNLGNDQALQASYQVMLENVAGEILGDDSLDDLDSEELSKKVFLSLLDDKFTGKVSSRDKILRALGTRNSRGVTPIDAYANNRVLELTLTGMRKLGEQYPEYKNYFLALERETGFKDPAKLAGALAELSFRVKRQKPETPDMFLNQALLDNMNISIEGNKTQWDSQLNPVRGSLMNLMFGSNPSVFIDNSLNTVFGTPSRGAWDKLQEVSEDPLFGRRVPGGVFDSGSSETQVFPSSVPLPVPLN